MSARLLGRTGKARGTEAEVTNVLIVGSGAESDLRIDSRTISRKHAQIVRAGSEYYLEDLGSRNGTFLNGQRVKRFPIRHLDVISMGPEVDLIFVESGAAAAIGPRPPAVRATIRWLDGPLRGCTEEVPPGRGMVLGRRTDLPLPALSRRHAGLTVVGDRLTVEDLGSANGTSVNGTRISGVTVLSDGDEVALGDLVRCRISVAAVSVPKPAPSSEGDPVTVLVDMRDARTAAPVLEIPSPVGATAPDPAPLAAAPSEPVVVQVPAMPVQVPDPASEPAVAAMPEQTQAVAPERPDAPPDTVVAPRTPAAAPVFGAAPRGPNESETFKPPPSGIGTIPQSIASRARAARTGAEGTVKAPLAAQSAPPETVIPEPAQAPQRGVARVRLEGPQRLELTHGSFTVGRHPDSTLHLDMRDVGRRHALMTVSDSGLVVEDLGSANGTFVNNVRAASAIAVPDGARLRFATAEFSVMYLREEA